MVKRRSKHNLAAWIEHTVHLPQGLAAEPGRVKLWPWQVEIADAISDPAHERVTLSRMSNKKFYHEPPADAEIEEEEERLRF